MNNNDDMTVAYQGSAIDDLKRDVENLRAELAEITNRLAVANAAVLDLQAIEGETASEVIGQIIGYLTGHGYLGEETFENRVRTVVTENLSITTRFYV